MHLVSNPGIPYWGHIPDGVHPGTILQIDGHVPHHADRFSINLYTGHESGHHAETHNSIALHINPRVNEDYVVFNTRHHKDWGSEDRHHAHGLHRGQSFGMTIHVEHDGYRVSVNGQHLCHFPHRVDLHDVHMILIEGQVDVHNIDVRHEHHHHHH